MTKFKAALFALIKMRSGFWLGARTEPNYLLQISAEEQQVKLEAPANEDR